MLEQSISYRLFCGTMLAAFVPSIDGPTDRSMFSGCLLRYQFLRMSFSGCLLRLSSLEKIEDLSKEYEWLYNVWFFDCHKLLQDQENKQYIDKMLQQSLLKECAAGGHQLSIIVPGSKIPSWFDEQQHGCNVALRLPPTLHTKVMGFAICGVFNWNGEYGYPRIIFKILNDEKVVPKREVEYRIESAAANNNCHLWVTYIPFGFFQQMYHDFQPQDWSHIQGSLVMTLMNTNDMKYVKCGAHVVYKEEMELIQQLNTCIPDYGNMVHVDGDNFHEKLSHEGKVSATTYVYEEKYDVKDSDLTPLRIRTTERTRRSEILDVHIHTVWFGPQSATSNDISPRPMPIPIPRPSPIPIPIPSPSPISKLFKKLQLISKS